MSKGINVQKNNKKLEKCIYCNSEFVKPKGIKRFCSYVCRNNHYNELKKPYKCKCIECGKEFENKIVKYFCGMDCRLRHVKKENTRYGGVAKMTEEQFKNVVSAVYSGTDKNAKIEVEKC